MNRIVEKFAQLKLAGKKGFVVYIGAGDPNLEATRQLALTFDQAGVDVLELGVPFSDPLADGLVNQLAAQRGLEAHAILLHPVRAGGRTADGQSSQGLVGLTARDPPEVAEKLLFGVGVDEYVRGCIVHASQVARMAAVAAAEHLGSAFEQSDPGPSFPRAERGAQRGIAAPNDKDFTVLQRP